MKTVALFDTSVSTLNKGDEIIMDSAKSELESILNGKFVVTGLYTKCGGGFRTLKSLTTF